MIVGGHLNVLDIVGVITEDGGQLHTPDLRQLGIIIIYFILFLLFIPF